MTLSNPIPKQSLPGSTKRELAFPSNFTLNHLLPNGSNIRTQKLNIMKKKLLTLIASAIVGLSAFAAATPQFPGGKEALDNYITTNLKYPERPLNQGIEGVVKVEFTVNTDGSIGSIKIVRLVDPDLEAEAIRLVKSMPAWIPADQGPDTATVEIPFLIPNEQ